MYFFFLWTAHNDYRAQHGAASLTLNDALTRMAQKHAQSMADKGKSVKFQTETETRYIITYRRAKSLMQKYGNLLLYLYTCGNSGKLFHSEHGDRTHEGNPTGENCAYSWSQPAKPVDGIPIVFICFTFTIIFYT